MTLKEKLDTLFSLKEELYELGMIAFSEKEVHVSSNKLEDFIDLSSGNDIWIENRNDLDYPYKAIFKKDGFTFFEILKERQKNELERLINEREAEESTND